MCNPDRYGSRGLRGMLWLAFLWGVGAQTTGKVGFLDIWHVPNYGTFTFGTFFRRDVTPVVCCSEMVLALALVFDTGFGSHGWTSRKTSSMGISSFLGVRAPCPRVFTPKICIFNINHLEAPVFFVPRFMPCMRATCSRSRWHETTTYK